MAGKPVIKGTRIPVDAILHRIAEGETIEEILADFPNITRKDVKAAILYAERVVGSESIVPKIK